MPPPEPAPPRLRHAHLASAGLLLAFLLFHLANHLIGLGGEAAHIAAMRAGRTVYRFPPVEALLLALFAWQATSGVLLVARGWRDRRDGIAWAQAASGMYLALFLAIHVSAVLIGRASEIDTDLRFAAQGIVYLGYAWFFIPYYFLALLALFTHLGCAAYWLAQAGGRPARPAIVGMMASLGALCGAAIVAMLSGALFEMHRVVPG